jgi:hypothetical protein
MLRRRFLHLASCSAAGAAVLWSLPRCSDPTAEEARRAVAEAIFGRTLLEEGLRVMERAELDARERAHLDALVAAARKDAELEPDLLRAHRRVVEKLLVTVYSDDAVIWPALGYPHGPGQCTGFDDYTRPAVPRG